MRWPRSAWYSRRPTRYRPIRCRRSSPCRPSNRRYHCCPKPVLAPVSVVGGVVVTGGVTTGGVTMGFVHNGWCDNWWCHGRGRHYRRNRTSACRAGKHRDLGDEAAVGKVGSGIGRQVGRDLRGRALGDRRDSGVLLESAIGDLHRRRRRIAGRYRLRGSGEGLRRDRSRARIGTIVRSTPGASGRRWSAPSKRLPRRGR